MNVMHFLSSVIELNANKSDSCCLIVIETVPAWVSQRVGSGQILLTPRRIYPPRLTPTQQQEAVATHSSCDRDGGQRGPKKHCHQDKEIKHLSVFNYTFEYFDPGSPFNFSATEAEN